MKRKSPKKHKKGASEDDATSYEATVHTGVLKSALTLRFVLLLSLSIVVMFSMFLIFSRQPILTFSMKFIASTVAFSLNLFGMKATATGILVKMPKMNLMIVYECTGIYAMMVYASCILAYPSSMKKKGIGLLFGIPGIYLLNVIRLVILGWIGDVSSFMFYFFHRYLWEVSFMFSVVMIWVLWVDKVAEKTSDKDKKDGK